MCLTGVTSCLTSPNTTLQVPVMVVWRTALSSPSHDPGFSCVFGLSAGLLTGLLPVGTGRLQVHWLKPGWKPASPPWVGLPPLTLKARKDKLNLNT